MRGHAGEAPGLRRSFALPAPGLSVSSLPCDAAPSMKFFVSLPANFIRGDAICEATALRRDPDQADRLILNWDAPFP